MTDISLNSNAAYLQATYTSKAWKCFLTSTEEQLGLGSGSPWMKTFSNLGNSITGCLGIKYCNILSILSRVSLVEMLIEKKLGKYVLAEALEGGVGLSSSMVTQGKIHFLREERPQDLSRLKSSYPIGLCIFPGLKGWQRRNAFNQQYSVLGSLLSSSSLNLSLAQFLMVFGKPAAILGKAWLW